MRLVRFMKQRVLEQVKKLPLSSGVYMFLDKKGRVLYVGRAVSLKKRAINYFSKNLEPRLKEMVGLAKKIKYRKTETILEAIILEANLIKKHWPKYNVREKDNRSFVYLIIPKTDYPRPIIVRQRELQKIFPAKSRIFGPYQSFSLLKSALRIIRRIFPYSTCRPFSGKPCFDEQIGLCPGLCLGRISKKDYQRNIKNIRLLLSGQKKRLLKKLEKENPEKAKSLKYLQDVSLIFKEDIGSMSKINRLEGYDISHLTGQEPIGAMAVFINGQADKSQYRLFKIKEAPKNDDLRALAEVIERRFKHLEWPKPDLILIDGGRPQINYIFQILKNLRLNIPLIGISKFKKDQLVFPSKTKKSLKELAQNIKGTLLRARNEAHRFSLKASRSQRKIKY